MSKKFTDDLEQVIFSEDSPPSDPSARQPEREILSDHTGYGEGGENFEHDNTGDSMNISGVIDDLANAEREHEGWQQDYDY